MDTPQVDYRQKISLSPAAPFGLFGQLAGASAATESVLYSFTGGSDGAFPGSALIMDDAGNLYGTTPNGGIGLGNSGVGTVYEVAPDGEETVLYAFTGGADGGDPQGGLLMDKAGNLYGTTTRGGASGFGAVFKVTP